MRHFSPSMRKMLRWFEYEHLPARLQEVSRPFHDLAWDTAHRLDESAELMAGLRKLLEAKDCIVRAELDAQ